MLAKKSLYNASLSICLWNSARERWKSLKVYFIHKWCSHITIGGKEKPQKCIYCVLRVFTLWNLYYKYILTHMQCTYSYVTFFYHPRVSFLAYLLFQSTIKNGFFAPYTRERLNFRESGFWKDQNAMCEITWEVQEHWVCKFLLKNYF